MSVPKSSLQNILR